MGSPTDIRPMDRQLHSCQMSDTHSTPWSPRISCKRYGPPTSVPSACERKARSSRRWPLCPWFLHSKAAMANCWRHWPRRPAFCHPDLRWQRGGNPLAFRKIARIVTMATRHRRLIRRLLRRGHPHRCYHCEAGLRPRQMTLEHLCSKRCGGSDRIENLRIACAACNNRRSDACVPDCVGAWRAYPSDRMWVGR